MVDIVLEPIDQQGVEHLAEDIPRGLELLEAPLREGLIQQVGRLTAQSDRQNTIGSEAQRR